MTTNTSYREQAQRDAENIAVALEGLAAHIRSIGNRFASDLESSRDSNEIASDIVSTYINGMGANSSRVSCLLYDAMRAGLK